MAFMPNMERTLSVRVESDGINAFTGGMDEAIQKLGKFRGAIGMAGGALAGLAVGGMAKATSAAADFEQAMVEVEKVTDAATAAALNDEIMGMAETIPMAQEELAALAADAARFGVRGVENIRAFSESVAKMAVATNLSSQEAGESLARLGTLTDTPADQIENLGSSINELSNNFATSAQEIVDSMLRSSAAMNQFGLEREQMIGMSAALNEVSESSRRAGTRLRRVAQELMNPRKVGDVAAALGMSVDEFERMRAEEPDQLLFSMAEAFKAGDDRADALRETLSTASRQAIAGLAQNLDAAREANEMANRSFEEGVSLQNEFDSATDTFNARLRTTRNRLGNIAIETGDSLLPVLSDLLGHVNTAIEWFDEWNTRTEGLAGQMVLATTAAAGLGAMVAWLVGGPMALLIGAPALLAAAWTTNFADIQGVSQRTFENIGGIADRFFGRFNDRMGNATEGNISRWKAFEIAVASGLDTLGVGFANLLDRVVMIWNQIVTAAETGADIFIRQLEGVAAAAGHLLAGEFEKANEAIAETNRETADEFKEGIDEMEQREQEFTRRREQRRRQRANRDAARRRALGRDDPSLLPSARGGGQSIEDAVAEQSEAAAQTQEAAQEYQQAAEDQRKAAETAVRARPGTAARVRTSTSSTGGSSGDSVRNDFLGPSGIEISEEEMQDALAKERLGRSRVAQKARKLEQQASAAAGPGGGRRDAVTKAVSEGTRQGLADVGKQMQTVDVAVRHELPQGDSVLERFIRETVDVAVDQKLESPEGTMTREERKAQRLAGRPGGI